MRINGPTYGSNYDQVAVSGQVTLNSPILSLTISSSYTPDGGTNFENIDVGSAYNQVQGTFSSNQIAYDNITIGYHDGDSNRDVVLTWIFYWS